MFSAKKYAPPLNRRGEAETSRYHPNLPEKFRAISSHLLTWMKRPGHPGQLKSGVPDWLNFRRLPPFPPSLRRSKTADFITAFLICHPNILTYFFMLSTEITLIYEGLRRFPKEHVKKEFDRNCALRCRRGSASPRVFRFRLREGGGSAHFPSY